MTATAVKSISPSAGARSVSPAAPRYPQHHYTGNDSDDNDEAPVLGMGLLVPPLKNGAVSANNLKRKEYSPVVVSDSSPRGPSDSENSPDKDDHDIQKLSLKEKRDWLARQVNEVLPDRHAEMTRKYHLTQQKLDSVTARARRYRVGASIADESTAKYIDERIAMLRVLEAENESMGAEKIALETAIAATQNDEEKQNHSFEKATTAIVSELDKLQALANDGKFEDFSASTEWEASAMERDLPALMANIISTTRQLQRRAEAMEKETSFKSSRLDQTNNDEPITTLSALERQRNALVSAYMKGIRQERCSPSPRAHRDSKTTKLYSLPVLSTAARSSDSHQPKSQNTAAGSSNSDSDEGSSPSQDENDGLSRDILPNFPNHNVTSTASKNPRDKIPQKIGRNKRSLSSTNISAMPGTTSRRKFIDPLQDWSSKPVWHMLTDDEGQGDRQDTTTHSNPSSNGYYSTYQQSYNRTPQNSRSVTHRTLQNAQPWSPLTSTYRKAYNEHRLPEAQESDVDLYPSYHRGRSSSSGSRRKFEVHLPPSPRRK